MDNTCDLKLENSRAEKCDEHEQILQNPNSKRTVMQENEDTTCGFWILKGPFLQKFANKKAYVVLFGILGCLYSASYAYFNGIISTVEKRFGIPSKVSGKCILNFRVALFFFRIFRTLFVIFMV